MCVVYRFSTTSVNIRHVLGQRVVSKTLSPESSRSSLKQFITFFAPFHLSRTPFLTTVTVFLYRLDAEFVSPLQISATAPASVPTFAHYSKPAYSIFVLPRPSLTPRMVRGSCTGLIRNVLGSGLPARTTNSTRTGSNLWGAGSKPASPRRRTQCGPRDGRHAFRQGHPLAPRGRRARQNPHSRALRFLTEKVAPKRRGDGRRISRQPQAPSLGSSSQPQTEINKSATDRDQVNPQEDRSCRVIARTLICCML
jgi:hypothetical protein